ncbi:F-box protein CPR1-like [Rosa rugosa]|uniref:F-box protein CPR1-like n=1 Tax=Rosa rugosa TaxID=74645 RepID=UPI002B412D4B|nr:F-box protein CPR1-like [Rosa rugosa]
MADSIPIRGQQQQINTVSRDFDEAIIVDILSRLPTKSLLRFCSVCKLWLTLISDPYFVKKHLSRVRTNCLKLLVATRGSQAAIISKEDNGNVAITELDFPNLNVIIWNPSTREFKRLPEAPTVDDDVPLGMPDPNELYWFGFGYDSTIEDYKVKVMSTVENRSARNTGSVLITTSSSDLE